jgi:hypothetical protein
MLGLDIVYFPHKHDFDVFSVFFFLTKKKKKIRGEDADFFFFSFLSFDSVLDIVCIFA